MVSCRLGHPHRTDRLPVTANRLVYTRATVAIVEGVARVGVRELRNNVAAVVRRAARGERIVITVDGVPAAQLCALDAAGPPSLDDLVAAGLVDPPRRSEQPEPPPPVALPIDVRLTAVLAGLRGDATR